MGQAAISVRTEGRPRKLAPALSEGVLRIAQEAIVNAIAHGRAQKIEVALAFETERVVLEVSDDGAGFDDGAGTEGPHFGLLGMRERAETLGGALRVEASPGGGARLAATLPAPSAAHRPRWPWGRNA